jgi:hypothetical protein
VRKEDRAALLALLNGKETALCWIENAIGRYKEDLPHEIEREQTPSAIATEAKRLHQALQTIAEQIAREGDAWLTFKQNCAIEGSEAIAALVCLNEALGPGPNEPADWLLSAAELTAQELKPTKKRPNSAAVAVRYNLVHHTALAARNAGVPVSRNSTVFQEIVTIVFRAANIHTDPDRDIRTLKSFI